MTSICLQVKVKLRFHGGHFALVIKAGLTNLRV
jgi:hypothetical protein